MRISILLIVLAIFTAGTQAQQPVQTVRGMVFEKETQVPLPGATIVLLDTDPLLAAISDPDGKFKIEDVPVGRYNIQVSYVGFEPHIIPEIMVGSAKEVLIRAGLKESLTNIDAVKVTANIKKDRPTNSMATISARMMNMDEAHRYAGGFDDPARLASSFAGVATGMLDDNAIVVRGNAPKGLLWRLEGVQIPNPNHFADLAVLGGGGITLFSSQMLTNSDFYTGAFPAEYGNVLSGVFDMKLRNGNSEQYEHAFKLGAMGVDIASEGPIKKGENASYLFNYRYSTFGIIKYVLPEDANLPVYQDFSFKVNIPTGKAGNFSLWGIGGMDEIVATAETDPENWETMEDRSAFNTTLNTGAIGFNHKYNFRSSLFLENIFSASGSNTLTSEEYLTDDLITYQPTLDLNDLKWRYTWSSKLTKRFSAAHTNRSGLVLNQINYNSDVRASYKPGDTLDQLVDDQGTTYLSQVYSQSKYEFHSGFTIIGGIHLVHFNLSNELSVEPRIGLSYKLQNGFVFNLGYGKHSQLEPSMIYLAQLEQNGETIRPNTDLRMTKSHHLVTGFDYSFSPHLRFKAEPYFQYLYDVPVIPDSSFSTINLDQSIYFNSALTNTGTGMNYGIDLTLERFLHRGYYYLITASVFDSKYKGGDNVWRNTKYNRNLLVNVLFGKEWQVRKNHFLSANGKLSLMGGNRAFPINYPASENAEEVIYDFTRPYEDRDPNIYQFDLTLTYKINKQNHSSSWAIQILNVMGRDEFYGYDYNYKTASVEADRVKVIVPAVSYKIDF